VESCRRCEKEIEIEMSDSSPQSLATAAAAAAAELANTAEKHSNINLFFGKDVAEVAKRSGDSTTEYIILQNDILHSQVKKATRSMDRLIKERDSVFGDREAVEKARVGLRGMLHNEIEKATLCEHILAESEKSLRKADERKLRSASRASVGMFACLAIVIVGVVSAHVNGPWSHATNALNALASTGVLTVIGRLSLDSKRDAFAEYEIEVIDTKAQLRAAEKGTEHLHAIVDEL
jgi:hypothetical protein